MPALPETAFFGLAPDWIGEVLSPSTAAVDKHKLPIYAGAGVAHAWLIDPEARTLEVCALAGAQWTWLATHGGEDRVRAAPFEAIELPLGAIWG